VHASVKKCEENLASDRNWTHDLWLSGHTKSRLPWV